MLRQLGRNGPSFVALHNLLDTMGTGGWKHSQVAGAASVDKKEISRIVATAKNHGALGFDARHGDLGQKDYSDAISLGEAQEIVLGAVRHFIHEHEEIERPGKNQPST